MSVAIAIRIFPLILILTSFNASASEQELYYHIHQATLLLEHFSKGECQDRENLIKDHLIKADRDLGETILKSKGSKKSAILFENDLQELWGFYNHRTIADLSQIEWFRLRIHEKAKLAQLNHDVTWYREYTLCNSRIFQGNE